MRLIDLDAFREEYDLREHCEDCGRRNKKACDYPSYSARDFCGWLDDAPTIDAVPIIRCEDCKHMHAVNLPDGQSWHYCPYMKFDVDPDFYCARGERRESGDPK